MSSVTGAVLDAPQITTAPAAITIEVTPITDAADAAWPTGAPTCGGGGNTCQKCGKVSSLPAALLV